MGGELAGFRTRGVRVAVRPEEHVIQIELTLASTREVRARYCGPGRTGSYASSDGESGRLPGPGSGGAWWVTRLNRAQPT